MQHNGSNGEVKPISARLTEKETIALKEALQWLEPEYPELLPGVLEKTRRYLGTKAWAAWLSRYYLDAAYKHFETAPPLPPLPATDESLRETANIEASSHRRFKEMRDRYLRDFDYFPHLEDLRGLWQVANEEAAKVFFASKRKRLDYTFTRYRWLIEDDLTALGEEIWRETEDYKAQVGAARLRAERQAAEYEAAMAVWEESRRLRRLYDTRLTGKERYDIVSLCASAEDYAFEFFEEFFSKEYTGWPVEYDPDWRGYYFPREAGEISNLLFSATGTLFLTHREKKGEKVPESNFVLIYGHFVCGYPLNRLGRFSPHDYRRAVHGFADWLAREKGKREGTLFDYGTFAYWTALLEKITVALFAGQLDAEDQCTLVDAPRNFHRRIKTRYTPKERSLFPELAYEKIFRAFLSDCLEGGKHRERSLAYFKARPCGRAKVAKFELIFNPECIKPEPSAEEQAAADAHCLALMTGSPIVFNSPEEFVLPPEENPLGEDPFEGDENAQAEVEQEEVD